jgi:hypothetical protein
MLALLKLARVPKLGTYRRRVYHLALCVRYSSDPPNRSRQLVGMQSASKECLEGTSPWPHLLGTHLTYLCIPYEISKII